MRFTVAAAAALAAAFTIGARPAHAQQVDDPTIVAIFDAANTWDMETGKLAEQRGASKAVRDFGAMLVRDHKQVRQQGRDLAKKLHVTPTPPKDFALAKVHADAMKKLRRLHGKAFDHAFLDNEVAYHQAVIDAVTGTLLPSTKNADLKDLEQKVAPAFVAHRDAAKNLLSKAD
jgi:putative membrane protein